MAQRSDGVRDLAGSISLWTPTCEVADIVNKSFAFIGVTIPAMLCASQPLEDEFQPSAVKVAQQRGASELGCPAATTEVISKHAIEGPQTKAGYQFPRRAEYTIAVSGCDKRATYLVACNKFRTECKAGSVPTSAGPATPRQLADAPQPDAVNAAQQCGAKEFACPATTTNTLRNAGCTKQRNDAYV